MAGRPTTASATSESQVSVYFRHTTCAQCYDRVGGLMQDVQPQKKYAFAQWYYRIGIVFTTGLAWVLRDYAGERLALSASSFDSCQTADDPGACGVQQVVMRLSWANCCFFALHALLMLRVRDDFDRRVHMHGALWLWKTLVWAGCIVGFFFVPTTALLGYAQIARIGSCVFLVLAMVRILDVVHRASDWISIEARANTGVWLLMVLSSITLFGLGLTLTGLCFRFFGTGPTCSLNRWFITWGLLAMIVMMAGLCLPKRGNKVADGREQQQQQQQQQHRGRADTPDGEQQQQQQHQHQHQYYQEQQHPYPQQQLLHQQQQQQLNSQQQQQQQQQQQYRQQSSSQAGSSHRPKARRSGGRAVPMRQASPLTSSAVFLYCSMLLVSALSSEPEGSECKDSSWTGSRWMDVCSLIVQLAVLLYMVFMASTPRPKPHRPARNSMGMLPYDADYFHLVYALASMFVGCILSNWQVSPSGVFQPDSTWVSTWLKIVTKWVCEAIYIAAVLSPACCAGGTLVVRAQFAWYRAEVEEEREALLSKSGEEDQRHGAAPVHAERSKQSPMPDIGPPPSQAMDAGRQDDVRYGQGYRGADQGVPRRGQRTPSSEGYSAAGTAPAVPGAPGYSSAALDHGAGRGQPLHHTFAAPGPAPFVEVELTQPPDQQQHHDPYWEQRQAAAQASMGHTWQHHGPGHGMPVAPAPAPAAAFVPPVPQGHSAGGFYPAMGAAGVSAGGAGLLPQQQRQPNINIWMNP